MICREQRRHGDRLVNAGEDAVEELAVEGDLHRAFGGHADPCHRFDGLYRVAADRCFGREHDGVGAVEHGVGNVGDFGARRGRGENH